MKKKSQIIAIVGTTAITISTPLAVYFSFQRWSTKDNKTYNFGENFFRKNVINDKNYLFNKINLFDGGENLGHLNWLDDLHFNNSNNKEFLKKDPENNLLADEPLTIDYSKMSSIIQIQKVYKQLNEKLANRINKIQNNNPEMDLGIEYFKDVLNSKVEIKLFEIKSFNEEDLQLINEYINDLGKIVKRKNGWTPSNFFRMYAPKTTLLKNYLEDYNFSLSNDFDEKWPEKKIGSKINKKFFAEFRKKENNNEVSDPSTKLILNQKFSEKNIFCTSEPFVDFKNKKVKVAIKFYKTGLGIPSQNIDKTLLKDYAYQMNIWNPKAIKTKIFEYDLVNFGNLEAPLRTRQQNKQILKNFFLSENSISAWVNRKIINIVFSLMGKRIPQLLSYSEKFFFLGKVFGSKKYSSIFDESQKVELTIDGKKREVYFLDWFLDHLQKSPYIDAEAFLSSANQFSSPTKILLKNETFKGDNITSFKDWNDGEKLRYLGGTNGGIFKIYHFHIVVSETYDKIIEAVESKFGPIEFKRDNQNNFRILFEFLKQKRLIEAKMKFNDFIDNYESSIPELLSKIAEKREEIPKNIIEIVLSLLLVSKYSKTFSLLVDNLYDLFLKNKFSLIWKVFGKDPETREKTIAHLFSWNTSFKALINIFQNDSIDHKPIFELLSFLSKVNLLPSFLKPSDAKKVHEFLTVSDKNGETKGSIIANFIEKTVFSGIKSISLDKIKQVFKTFINNEGVDKLSEQIYNFIQNGLGGEQSKVNKSIEGIISLIKLFLEKNSKNFTRWFDQNQISSTLNKLLNNGLDELDVLSYKTIFKLIFKNLKPIEDIAKKLGLENQENIAPKLRDFIAKISYKFLNQGISNFDDIKTEYDAFINDPNNSEIKIALHTFINQKITKKEKQLEQIVYEDTDSLEKLTGEWNSWNNKYIPKINYDGYEKVTGETTIDSLLDMNLIDFILVFAKNSNLDPIKDFVQKDNEDPILNLKTRLEFSNYLDYKNYFGTLFNSFKKFYETNGQFAKKKVVNDDEFKNYNFLNKIKFLNNDQKYESIFNILTDPGVNASKTLFNNISNKFLNLIINITKTGLSTTKENWITHIKNLIDLMKNIDPFIKYLSTIEPSINQYVNKYIYGLVEIFQIAQKQSDGSYNYIDPNDNNVGTNKVEAIATSISNVFNKAINDANSSNNISENDFNFVWQIVKYFLEVFNKNGKKSNDFPTGVPSSIKRILINKESFGNLSSSDIDELISIFNFTFPESTKTFNVFKTLIKQILVGENKIYLEKEVKNFYYENVNIEFASYSDNKFSSHEERIKKYLQINSKKGILKVEELIIDDKNIILNKNDFIKFKAKYVYTIDEKNKVSKQKFSFISPEFKIKISDRAKYNLQNILDLRVSNKIIEDVYNDLPLGKLEPLETGDEFIYKFNNVLNFKNELDKKGYELVKLEAYLNDDSKYSFKQPFLLIVEKSKKAELKSWIENRVNLTIDDFSSTKTFFENININNVLSNSKTIERLELNDFNLENANIKTLTFKTNPATNKANSNLGIYGVILVEPNVTSSPQSLLSSS